MANMSLKAALPKVELYLYSLVLTLTVLWSASWIYEASTDNMSKQTFEQSVRRGWPYIGRKMDMADFEWVMWFTKFRNYILFALTGHVLFAKAVSMSLPQYRSTYFMIYGILAVLATMGVSYLMLILSHCILLYGVGLAKQKWLCFAAGLCSLATFKMEPVASWQTGFVTGTFQLQDVLFYGGSGFTIMRCMSFALENVEKKGGNYSILDLLIYNFYLPFFFFGPVMTFDQFHVQVNQSKFARKENEMWNIGKRALVHLAVIILVDVFFHYLYILTIPSDLKLAATLSDWALACLAYFNLVYDWIKAAVLFGVVGTVARLDYLDPPKPPKCITMLYVFAETHFDRGINDWLCKYVYDYLGEDHTNIVKELLATVCTFLVTTLWLGPESVVYIWSVCNCFGLNFELWVQKFFELQAFATIEAKQMSKAMSRRIRGAFGAANFWAIILYNILSLNSVDFALLVAKRLFLAGLFNSLTACGKKLFPSLEVLVFMLLYLFLEGFPLSPITILFVTYCGVQLVKENERKLALEAEKKKAE